MSPLSAVRQGFSGRGRFAVAIAAALLPLASVMTYHRVADGAFLVHAAAQCCAAAASAALVLAFLVRNGGGRPIDVGITPAGRARVPLGVLPAAIAALLLSTPAPAVHAVRLAGRAAGVTVAFATPLEYGRVLVPVLRGAATLGVEADHVAVRTPSGSVGFLEVRPVTPAAAPLTAAALPRALAAPGTEATRLSIAWRARIERERGYFGLVDVDGERITAQVTEWGLLVTAPGPNGQLDRRDVSLAVGSDWRDWELRRGPEGITLLMDGKPVWTAPLQARLSPVRIGEARSDAEHGGTLRVARASVTVSAA